MKLRTIRYYLVEAVHSLIKNRLMTVASILTVSSCIFIVSVFYCLVSNIEFLLNELEGSIEITVFVDESLTADEVIALSETVSAIPHVTSTQYVSSKEAFEEFKKGLDDPRILDGLERDNPLRRSFNIAVDDLRYQNDVLHALNELEKDGISNIKHSQDVAAIMLAVSNVIRIVCMVMILFLAIISIVIITNTIRVAVNSRKREINIMKYVGATDWFIRWPFLIEGIIIGLIGALIPVVICWLSYNEVVAMIKEGLPIISFIQFRAGYDIFAYLFPFSLFLGIMIGAIGSTMSIRRHLNV